MITLYTYIKYCVFTVYSLFFILSNDHFIANKTDNLPTILLDHKGIDHGFVIHSDQCSTMAKAVADWIKIMQQKKTKLHLLLEK